MAYGMWSNITDEDIENADTETNPEGEMGGEEAMGGMGGEMPQQAQQAQEAPKAPVKPQAAQEGAQQTRQAESAMQKEKPSKGFLGLFKRKGGKETAQAEQSNGKGEHLA